MRTGTWYRWRRARTGGSLLPFCCLLLLPLIVAALTVFFLGYAGWQLALLLGQLPRLTRSAVRTQHVTNAPSRATTYP